MNSGTGRRSATVDNRNDAQSQPKRGSQDDAPNKLTAQELLGSPPPSPSIHASTPQKFWFPFASRKNKNDFKKGLKDSKPKGSNGTLPLEEPRFDSNESVSALAGETPATTSENVETEDARINHEDDTIGGLADEKLKEKLQNVANRLIQSMDASDADKKTLMDQLQDTEQKFETFKGFAEKVMAKATTGLVFLGDVGQNIQGSIDGFMTFIDTVAEIHPIMKLTWMVLSYGYKNDTKHDFGAFLTQYLQIRQKAKIIEDGSTTVLDLKAKQLLKSSVDELQKSLLASVELYLQYAQASCFGKLTRKYSEDLDTLSKNLERVFQDLIENAQLVSYLKIDIVIKKVENLTEITRDTNEATHSGNKKLDSVDANLKELHSLMTAYHVGRLPDYFSAHVLIGELVIVEQLKQPPKLSDLKKKIDERASALRGAAYGLFMEDKDGNHVRLSDDDEFQQMCKAYPDGIIHVDGLEIGVAVDVIFPSDNLVEISEIRAESAFDVMFSYCRKTEFQVHRIILALQASMPDLKVCTNKRNITSDAYEGMAEAVIKSSIIVVCLSADYLESDFCRQEVEYAFHLKKRIVCISMFESTDSARLETQAAQRLPFLGNCCAEFSGLNPSLSEWSTQLQKLVQTLVEEGKTDKVTDETQIWLDPVDVNEDLNQYDRENVPGTCSWVTKCIEVWMLDSKAGDVPEVGTDARNVPNVMWLSDGAGTGKSFISYRVWQEASSGLNPNLLPGSVFFCKHNDVKKSEPDSIVRTIAWNLGSLFPSMKDHLAKQLQKDKVAVQDGKQSILTKVGEAFKDLVIDGLKVAVDNLEVDLTKQYLIVVDALDECNAETRSAFLKILRNSKDGLPPFIKLFVTGRPEVDVYTAMKEADPFILEPSKENTTEDIKKFVHFRLSALERWGATNPENIGKMEKCEEEINKKADNLFVYARNICQYLRDGKFSLSEALDAIQGFSSGADSVYKAILAREHKKTNPSGPSAFRRVFRVILAVRKPLDVATLRSIGHLDFYETVQVISQYRSILKVENNEVAVIHKSLYDFLTTRSRCGTVFFISLRNAETELAQNCFEILKTQLFQNMAELDASQFYNHISVADIMDQGKFLTSAVVYAATFWGHHFVSSAYPPDLIPELHTFCRTKLIHWLELMLIQKNLRGVILTIASVQQRLSKFSENKDTKFVQSILEDVRKIAISCRNALTTSPLQVYRHALLAAPRNSEFFQTFSSYSTYEMSTGKPKIWGTLPLLGHTNLVLSTSFSKSGKFVVSGSKDMTVRVWLLETGECIQTLENVHKAAVSSVMFLDDEKSVASVSEDEQLVLWTLETNHWKILHPKVTGAEAADIPSVSICASKLYLVMGSTKGVKIWIREGHEYHRVETLKVMEEVNGRPVPKESSVQKESVTAIAMCQNGDFFLTGSNQSISCWDLRSAALTPGTMTLLLKRLKVYHSGKVLSICISKQGSWAASSDSEGGVKFFDTKTGKAKNEMTFHVPSGFVTSISLSPDDKSLVRVSNSGAVVHRCLQTQTDLKTIPAHLSRAHSVQMAVQGDVCVSGGSDAAVRITTLSGDFEEVTIGAQNTCVSVSPNCKYAVSGNTSAIVTLYDVQTGNILVTLRDGYWTSEVRVLNDMTVAVGDWDGVWKICHPVDKEVPADTLIPMSKDQYQEFHQKYESEHQLASAPIFELEEKDGWIRSKASRELIFDLTMAFNHARYDIPEKPEVSSVGNVIAWIIGNATWVISFPKK
ncbi:hypothetical protein CcCBS67573_g06301 [Chytriomyces confervae]|uniref:Uncharacterized protein n=1 Tax=Chytriomyces confervae TaxID=246404 RepID=A0A507F427_9FUNG|nr:hypothetical protein CcCBS67573_g06301 [Chytriomyces confervae]